MQKALKRWLFHPLEASLVRLFFLLCGNCLSVERAANLSAGMARCLGPLTPSDRTMRRNLTTAFPNMTKERINQIARGVWDNLGRNLGEWAHFNRMQITGPNPRITVVGEEHFQAVVAKGGAFIVFSGHIANWELAALTCARLGVPLACVYREIANPWLDAFFLRQRQEHTAQMIPKGRKGAKQILEVIKKREGLGFLVDQKFNEGIAIPFFGREAMTAPAMADLALRHNCPLLPIRVERQPHSRFRIGFYPPIPLPRSDDHKADVRRVMTEVNALLESWIREKPEQWFWVHNRWPKD